MTSIETHVVQTNVTDEAVVVYSTGKLTVAPQTFFIESTIVVKFALRITGEVFAGVSNSAIVRSRAWNRHCKYINIVKHF